jgi:hypothetical protein
VRPRITWKNAIVIAIRILIGLNWLREETVIIYPSFKLQIVSRRGVRGKWKENNSEKI